MVIKMVKDKQITWEDKKFYDDVIKALDILNKYVANSNLNATDTELVSQMYDNAISSLKALATVILLEFNKYNEHKEQKFPEKVYITHKHIWAGRMITSGDFFVYGNTKFEEQGYEMEDCPYVHKFLVKYPMYRYAFSDDNDHVDGWEVDFTGWVDVTDWLKGDD